MSAKHSMVVNGTGTSLTVDVEFWKGLQEIALYRGTSVAALVNDIDKNRSAPNLSSAVRVFVLEHFVALSREGLSQSALPPPDEAG